MKLYAWVVNERGVLKTQGGNKGITIDLDYEEPGQSYHCNTAEHAIRLAFGLDENKKPVIFIRGSKAFRVEDKRAEW